MKDTNFRGKQRKPGETIHELAARIRHDAATCDFPRIKNPQEEKKKCAVTNRKRDLGKRNPREDPAKEF